MLTSFLILMYPVFPPEVTSVVDHIKRPVALNKLQMSLGLNRIGEIWDNVSARACPGLDFPHQLALVIT